MALLIPERVAGRIKDLGLTQSDVARAAGLSQPSVGRFITGETRRTSKVLELAQSLRTTPEYLTGETDDPGLSVSDRRLSFDGFPDDAPKQLAAQLDLVPVRELDLAFGMGATFLDVPVTEVVRHFPAAWLRQYSKAPAEQLVFASGAGDSMFPTLLDSDTLLIDCSQPTMRMSDQIWALSYCGLGMIKRLRPSKDGGLRLLSDNPAVPEVVAYDDEAQLIGRVVAVMRKM